MIQQLSSMVTSSRAWRKAKALVGGTQFAPDAVHEGIADVSRVE
jgi:hypothetical protein